MTDTNQNLHDEPDHIQGSTLIPDSHFSSTDDPADQVSVVPESHIQEAGAEAKPMAAAIKGEKSFIQRHTPFVVVGVIATVIVAALVIKGGDGGQPVRVAKAPANSTQVASTETPSALSGSSRASTSTAPIEISNASIPGSPAALEAENAAIAARNAPASIAVVAPEVVVQPQSAPSSAATEALSNDVVRLDGQVLANTAAIAELKARLDAQAEKKESASTSTASAGQGLVTTSQPVARVAEKHRVQARSTDAKRPVPSNVSPAAYSVHIVRDNLVWLTTPGGSIRSYSVGDFVPGLGKISKISVETHSAVAGNRTIK